MKAHIDLIDRTLIIRFEDVLDNESNRGRMCNVELALLREYGNHNYYPSVYGEGLLEFVYCRQKSNKQTLEDARKVLQGFGFEV
jgi:hypothetical protein